jgi:shikimate dehydrogenase
MTLFKHELIGGIGLPIAENPTGIMHEAAFDALGLRWRYQLLEVGPDELGDLVRGMKAMKFMGANFTIPHKVAIIDHLDGVAESAQLIGAVNTIRLDEKGGWIGENTDGKGFTGALAEKNVPVAGKNVTLLGAGGAARAISVELALAGVQNITIVNRSAKRAEPLAKVINDETKTKATFVPWRGTYAVDAATDILVNATSIGLFPSTDKPDIDYGGIARGMVVVDVIPNPPETPFLNEAARHGARTIDGLAMLVAQGAIAFEMWTGKPAPRDIMRKALAEGLGLS